MQMREGERGGGARPSARAPLRQCVSRCGKVAAKKIALGAPAVHDIRRQNGLERERVRVRQVIEERRCAD